MIKLENVVLPSPKQMAFIIEGMRNPINSWGKSDSHICRQDGSFCMECEHKNGYCLGGNDHSLMQRLSKVSNVHRKFMRMMSVYVKITAPMYWWEAFNICLDANNVDTVAIPCRISDKFSEREFTLEDFSTEHLSYPSLKNLKNIIKCLNDYRQEYLKDKEKHNWWQMVQLLPKSYNQTCNVMLNYEVLKNIYRQQDSYLIDEWKDFCNWIKELPYSDLITGENNKF